MSLDFYLVAPSKCPHCGGELEGGYEVFSANITHNLGRMAREAGIYEYLWHPEMHNITEARQLIAPLGSVLVSKI